MINLGLPSIFRALDGEEEGGGGGGGEGVLILHVDFKKA